MLELECPLVESVPDSDDSECPKTEWPCPPSPPSEASIPSRPTPAQPRGRSSLGPTEDQIGIEEALHC